MGRELAPPVALPWAPAGGRISAVVLARRLAARQIPIRQTRTTALIELAQGLPPAILAPMLGLHIITAQQGRAPPRGQRLDGLSRSPAGRFLMLAR